MLKSYLYILPLLIALSFQIHADNADPVFVVHFEIGPNWQKGLAPNQQSGFDEHSQNLQRLRKNGTIKFGARYQQYGLIFITAASLEDASKLLDADPGVISGLFTYRIAKMNIFYPWQDSTDLEG
ncbi:MAG: hypothetical protein ACFHVJ_17325 [Aestuariibacter sp.]